MLEERKPFKASDGPMTVLIAFVAMLVGQVVFSVIISVMQMNGSNNKTAETINLIAMMVFQGIYLTTYFIYTKHRGIKSSFSVGNKLSFAAVGASIGIALVCFFCFSGLSQLFEYLLAQTGYTPSELNVNGAFQIVMLVIVTVILAPIGEETIFRAAFLSGAEKTDVGELGISLMSGLLFALMHINPSQTVYQFCLGAASAYALLKVRNVIASMIIHSCSNLLAILLSFTEIGAKISRFYVEQIGHNVIVTLIFCVLLPIVAVVFIWFICKTVKKYEQKKFPDKFEAICSESVCKDKVPSIGALIEGKEQARETASDEENGGFLGKNTFKITLGIYIILTAVLWASMLITRIIS